MRSCKGRMVQIGGRCAEHSEGRCRRHCEGGTKYHRSDCPAETTTRRSSCERTLRRDDDCGPCAASQHQRLKIRDDYATTPLRRLFPSTRCKKEEASLDQRTRSERDRREAASTKGGRAEMRLDAGACRWKAESVPPCSFSGETRTGGQAGREEATKSRIHNGMRTPPATGAVHDTRRDAPRMRRLWALTKDR